MFVKLISSHKGFVNAAKRNYQRMSTEEYLLNTRESFTNTKMSKAKLKPLLEANHTSDTVTQLYALPLQPYETKNLNYFINIVAETMPDLIFL